jgi:hypothetical protein
MATLLIHVTVKHRKASDKRQDAEKKNYHSLTLVRDIVRALENRR